jgi:hypothetical protein
MLWLNLSINRHKQINKPNLESKKIETMNEKKINIYLFSNSIRAHLIQSSNVFSRWIKQRSNDSNADNFKVGANPYQNQTSTFTYSHTHTHTHTHIERERETILSNLIRNQQIQYDMNLEGENEW